MAGFVWEVKESQVIFVFWRLSDGTQQTVYLLLIVSLEPLERRWRVAIVGDAAQPKGGAFEQTTLFAKSVDSGRLRRI